MRGFLRIASHAMALEGIADRMKASRDFGVDDVDSVLHAADVFKRAAVRIAIREHGEGAENRAYAYCCANGHWAGIMGDDLTKSVYIYVAKGIRQNERRPN